ncbi:MAG TPA: hypothetical protein VK899_05690 [Gemmatimonadales bacterium]|nr:hypothetical protein [Gemmatimonadales bacterium]
MDIFKVVDKWFLPMLMVGLTLLVLLGVAAAAIGLVGCGIVGADIPMCSN